MNSDDIGGTTQSRATNMEPNHLYHIYNRGNNRQRIFFTQKHYFYFQKKMLNHLTPHVSVLAFCLMPNHFHLLVYTKGSYCEKEFKQHFKTMLSSYTRGVNIELGRCGSLFQQNSKFKLLKEENEFYPIICFNYIHQNPYRAGLVEKLENWRHSSYPHYCLEKQTPIIDEIVAKDILNLPNNADEIKRLSRELVPDGFRL